MTLLLMNMLKQVHIINVNIQQGTTCENIFIDFQPPALGLPRRSSSARTVS